VDIVPKLRNATRAINPYNRFMGTSIRNVRIICGPCPMHNLPIPSTNGMAVGATDKITGWTVAFVQCPLASMGTQ
jgi:hypothetical protein